MSLTPHMYSRYSRFQNINHQHCSTNYAKATEHRKKRNSLESRDLLSVFSSSNNNSDCNLIPLCAWTSGVFFICATYSIVSYRNLNLNLLQQIAIQMIFLISYSLQIAYLMLIHFIKRNSTRRLNNCDKSLIFQYFHLHSSYLASFYNPPIPHPISTTLVT